MLLSVGESEALGVSGTAMRSPKCQPGLCLRQNPSQEVQEELLFEKMVNIIGKFACLGEDSCLLLLPSLQRVVTPGLWSTDF